MNNETEFRLVSKHDGSLPNADKTLPRHNRLGRKISPERNPFGAATLDLSVDRRLPSRFHGRFSLTRKIRIDLSFQEHPLHCRLFFTICRLGPITLVGRKSGLLLWLARTFLRCLYRL